MKQILIIEDDTGISEIQRDYLTMSGYGVTCVFDGAAGLRELQSGKYDLCILDIMLPEMDGFEILKRVRDEEIPILIVSARDEEMYKIRGLNLGADDYITKPFSMGEMVARVHNHLKVYDKIRKKEDIISIRGLQLDRAARRVTVDGREAELTGKEFDLLCFLAENAGKVFDRELLYERVWGLDALSDTTTVTVHIARIREKIEENPQSPRYVETVWGVGYRLRV